MSALYLAKKYWIIGFMTILLCCHGFGLLVRTVTYIWPNVIFNKGLQDYLERIFKFFVVVWCVSWIQSILVYFIQLALINYGFDKDTTFTCKDDDCEFKDLDTSKKNDEWRLSIIFRAI